MATKKRGSVGLWLTETETDFHQYFIGEILQTSDDLIQTLFSILALVTIIDYHFISRAGLRGVQGRITLMD